MSATTTFAIQGIKSATVQQKRDAIAFLKQSIKDSLEDSRQEREEAKAAKAAKAAERREAAIAKAQARLQKLLDKANPVGVKALKANRKPSAVTVFTQESNQIASAIMARKASA